MAVIAVFQILRIGTKRAGKEEVAVAAPEGIKAVIARFKIAAEITVKAFVGGCLLIHHLGHIGRVLYISHVKALEAVFAVIDVIAEGIFTALEEPGKEAWMLGKFRSKDFEDFLGRIFFKLLNLLSIHLLGIYFVEDTESLLPQPETTEAILAVDTIEAEFAL